MLAFLSACLFLLIFIVVWLSDSIGDIKIGGKKKTQKYTTGSQGGYIPSQPPIMKKAINNGRVIHGEQKIEVVKKSESDPKNYGLLGMPVVDEFEPEGDNNNANTIPIPINIEVSITKIGEPEKSDIVNKDPWDDIYVVPRDMKCVDARFEFDYIDLEKNRTHRVVRVQYFDVSNAEEPFLRGFCKLRQANRPFRLKRMKECVDLDTGEVVTNIRQHLEKRYKDSTYHTIEKINDKVDTKKIIMFMINSTGGLDEKSKLIVSDFYLSVYNDDNLSLGQITKTFNDINPSYVSFKNSINRILHSKHKYLLKLKECCHNLYVLQQNKESTLAINYMDRKFNLIER